MPAAVHSSLMEMLCMGFVRSSSKNRWTFLNKQFADTHFLAFYFAHS